MTTVRSVAYGPAPWHQTSWDARAAGNFIGGGAGTGLIVFTVLAGASGPARTVLLLAGLASIALGLGSVALEMGRPLRALNVFRHPGRSWMSREAIAAVMLMVVTLGAVAGYAGLDWLAVVLALAFAYCQARLLQAAKGIPAWHESRVVPLLLTTALAEGGGLVWMTASLHHAGGTRSLLGLAALLVLRLVLCHTYLRRVGKASRAAGRALVPAARVLAIGGTFAPLLLIVLATMLPYAHAIQAAALAGALAWAAGAYLKLVIVTRAGFNRGFTLPELPVRGTRA